ncbi:MAG: membrane-bound lytic murein transglycosylase MltF [Kangiellaceae bacterium]|nr:membrane-bound lytic murein transglycosylase MltF [Kangiellaceae bacterium]|tara:strand:- start:3688 stop:5085 length:1398 start_codon:yes stop_codon:yes gene_type:complete
MSLPTHNKATYHFILPLLLCFLPLLIAGYGNDEGELSKHGNVLRVVTRNAPTTYYYGHQGPEGFEFELAKAFADWSGRQLQLKTAESVTGLIGVLNRKHADIVAAGITVTPRRKKYYSFGPGYLKITQQLICPIGLDVSSDLKALEGLALIVNQDSSFEENLKALQAQYPRISWHATDNLDVEEILFKVSESDALCTITDSNIFDMNRRYFPHLRRVMDVSDSQQFGWMIGNNRPYLQDELYIFFAQPSTQLLIEALYDKYYGNADAFDYVDISVYNRRIASRLPNYVNEIQLAADTYNIPWMVLAAQAYQESHWDPKAKSPTGVRGFMMLTQNTAKSVGVTNRLDAKQNIWGGAKYLSRLQKRIPKEIHEPDKLKFALAAYNVGMGHLWDAIGLAKRLGYDYRYWENMAQVLPLLAQKKYYSSLRYGYARGLEPVLYVERISDYHDILRQHQLFKEDDYYVSRE